MYRCRPNVLCVTWVENKLEKSSPDFFGSVIIMRMRDPLFSETVFPPLDAGTAKQFCQPHSQGSQGGKMRDPGNEVAILFASR